MTKKECTEEEKHRILKDYYLSDAGRKLISFALYIGMRNDSLANPRPSREVCEGLLSPDEITKEGLDGKL